MQNTDWVQKLIPARIQRLGREFFWIGLGQAIATAGSLVGVRLLTDVLSPVIYGELALGMTLATLLNQTILGPLTGAATRFYAPASESRELGTFLAALRRLLAKATGVVFLLVAGSIVVLLIARQTRQLGLALAAYGFALLSGYNAILNGLQNAARQRTIVAWHQALYAWGRSLAAIGLILWIGVSSDVAMFGYMLSTLLVLFSQFWFFRRLIKPTATGIALETANVQRWESDLFRYAWPFTTWGIFTWAQMASDRWALQLFNTTQSVGLYTALYQLGYYPITLLSGLMVQLVAPVFFQRAGDASDASRVRQVHTLNQRLAVGSLILTVGATLITLPLHKVIFQWFVAPDYRTVSWLLPGMVMAGGLFATGQFATVSLLSNVDTRNLIAPKIVTAILGTVLNIVGAVYGNIAGVVIASIVTSLIYLLWVLYLVKQQADQLQPKA